jgi:hypothetical protein
MEGAPFELNVTFPTDARYAATVRELAMHAAKHAGFSEARASAFADEVDGIVRGYLESGGGGATLPLVFRRTTGPIEVLVNGRTLILDP